jgi:DNA damage-inducible protein 1
MRLQILGDPNLMRQLAATRGTVFDVLYYWIVDTSHLVKTQPNAAQSNPARFAELLGQTRHAEMELMREIERLNADPFNAEAQRQIEAGRY